jgi:exosortase
MAAGARARVLRDWAGPALVAALALVVYWRGLSIMVGEWRSNPDAGHGFLIVPIAAYLAWRRRAEFRAQPAAVSRPALAVVVAALLLYLLARYAEIEFLSAVSFLLLVGGVLWHALGAARLRVWAFPYLFLWFMIPWPDLLVEFLSFPMQLWSARLAAAVIGLFGTPVIREGVNLHVADYTFAVAAPCSGMRSLIALMALAALLAYLCRGALWRRSVVFLLGLPMALIANVIRIVIVVVIGARLGAGAAESFFHLASGLVVFVVAVAGLYGIARALGLRIAVSQSP